MYDLDSIDTHQAQSPTAIVCENAQLYGATPERDEFDPREVWDRDDAIDAVSEAFRVLAEGVAPDGFQLADERESLLWGFVNCLDAQVRRLDRGVDRLAPQLRDLQRAQDGTEINARELELVTDRARNLGDRRDAFEQLRDAAADAYRGETGDTWRRTYGSNILTQRCFLPPDSAGTHGIGPRFRPGCNATQEEYRWRRFASTNAASTRLSPASPPTTFATAS